MLRALRMGIVLGMALATLGVAVAAAQGPSDAIDRAQANQTAVPSDAFERGATTLVVVPTDAHERGTPATTTPASAEVADSGWAVSWTSVALGAAIVVGVAAAGAFLVIAIRRHPPRGHPPLAHR